ncbi:MAG: restriction endonuclease subunit S [Planctomycetota bacterium]
MPQQLGDNSVTTDGIARITETDRDRLSRHVMKKGDIVFSRRGDVTRRAFITAKEAGWLCGTGCLLLRIEHPKCDNRFLARYLSLPSSKTYLEQHAVGATMPNLNQGILRSVPLRLPPIPTQQAIVGILSAYDDLIANNTRRIKLLEDAARLLYEEWFVRLRFPGHEHTPIQDGVPQGWDTKTVSELCETVKDTVDPSRIEPTTPYIGLEHIPRRSITLADWGRAEQVESSKHRFVEGDILFGKIRAYFHKVGLAMTDGITSSDAIVIRANGADQQWLLLMTTSSDQFVRTAAQTAREGSKMPRADWSVMQQYRVLIPSRQILLSFNDFVEPITRQLKSLAFGIRRATEARDLLLPRLMSGEVAV